MNQLQIFKEKLEQFEELYQSENNTTDSDQLVWDLEEEVNEELEMYPENTHLMGLLKKIKSLKKEYDFYDADAELGHMFPNRQDEDFDEDSTSYDSVFGDD